jgi:hypothetical protein
MTNVRNGTSSRAVNVLCITSFPGLRRHDTLAQLHLHNTVQRTEKRNGDRPYITRAILGRWLALDDRDHTSLLGSFFDFV